MAREYTLKKSVKYCHIKNKTKVAVIPIEDRAVTYKIYIQYIKKEE